VDVEKVEFEILNEIPEETEEAYAVMIPRRDQNTQDCFDAKTAELAKLKEFQTYDEVEDLGQDYISSTWVTKVGLRELDWSPEVLRKKEKFNLTLLLYLKLE